jgi:excisionase family DNA binding protein
MANKFLSKLDQIHQEIRVNSIKEILTIEDACLLMGLSKSYVYRLTSEQQIPHYKPLNKVIYFKRSEIERWIFKNKIHSIEELKTQHHFLNNNKKKISKSETFKY